jgi:hypothetical protein
MALEDRVAKLEADMFHLMCGSVKLPRSAYSSILRFVSAAPPARSHNSVHGDHLFYLRVGINHWRARRAPQRGARHTQRAYLIPLNGQVLLNQFVGELGNFSGDHQASLVENTDIAGDPAGERKLLLHEQNG